MQNKDSALFGTIVSCNGTNLKIPEINQNQTEVKIVPDHDNTGEMLLEEPESIKKTIPINEGSEFIETGEEGDDNGTGWDDHINK